MLFPNDPASPGLAGSQSGLANPQFTNCRLFARALSTEETVPMGAALPLFVLGTAQGIVVDTSDFDGGNRSADSVR